MKLNTPIFLLSLGLMMQFPAVAQDKTNPASGGSGKPTAAHQNLTQTVRGIVTDAASKQPIPGAVVVLVSNSNINTATDDNGYFSMSNVPVGRQSFQVIMAGYEPQHINEVLVISGKAMELNIAMNESIKKLDEVTISANKDRVRPLNEFATVSARSFSVEETRRYAASFADPARMVMNFPGVSNAGDLENSIVVRGNSPKGVLWRLEGIEIPNPNHFSSLGSSGGGISMLNGNVLGNSDFYTGAFVPEIGNALAGVFDINFRNGNTERAEHTVQLGVMGAELATEGPFKKGKRASYLFNYRYSTLALVERFIKLGGSIPKYQDAAMKINLPTEKAGTFTLFGLGGYNNADKDIQADSTTWDDDNPNLNYKNNTQMLVTGASHQYFVSKDAYIKTVVSASFDKTTGDADTLNPAEGYAKVPIEHSSYSNTAYRISVMYNQKFSPRHTFRAGVIGQQLAYALEYSYYDGIKKQWSNLLSGDGGTQYYQVYAQSRVRLTENLAAVVGVHGSYFALNGKNSIEPRVSFEYQLSKNKFTLASGLHSKPEHISTYLYQNAKPGEVITYPNKDLDLLRAFHLVGGYERVLPAKIRFKSEVYYQKLYSIPVETDTSKSFSMLNAEGAFSLIGTNTLVSEGTGENYGIDISIERPFINNYYIIATGSVYKSTYTDYNNRTYNTRFNRGHQINLIGGKEFKLNSSGKKLIGLNGKLLYSGGLRESKIDLASSIASKSTVIYPGQYFAQQGDAYFRADIGVYYKFNTKNATHTLQLDAQNVTNRENYYFSYFDADAGKINRVNQLGILPSISYRIDFHW